MPMLMQGRCHWGLRMYLEMGEFQIGSASRVAWQEAAGSRWDRWQPARFAESGFHWAAFAHAIDTGGPRRLRCGPFFFDRVKDFPVIERNRLPSRPTGREPRALRAARARRQSPAICRPGRGHASRERVRRRAGCRRARRRHDGRLRGQLALAPARGRLRSPSNRQS